MKTTTKENAVNADLENIWNMVEDMKQREEVRKGYMKFQELLQEERAEERRKTEEERRKAEKLIAEANERAEQSEERANQATERAEQAERKILALERELEKYKK